MDNQQVEAGTKHGHTFVFEAFDPEGNLKWKEEVPNLVVDEGLDDILDVYYNSTSYAAAHYVGITDGGPVVADGDTMGSHTGWGEVAAYDEAARPDFTPGTVSAQSLDNSSNVATFSINAASTVIGGGFLTTDSTIGGTAGTLIGAAAFDGGDRTLGAGDTLNVTVTANASST